MIARVLSTLHVAGCLERWQLHYAVFFLSNFIGHRVGFSVVGDSIEIDGLDELVERLDDLDVVSGGGQVCLVRDELGEKAYEKMCEEYGCSAVDRAVGIVAKLRRKELIATFACFGYGACNHRLRNRLEQYRFAVSYLLYTNKLIDERMASKVAGASIFKLLRFMRRVFG